MLIYFLGVFLALTISSIHNNLEGERREYFLTGIAGLLSWLTVAIYLVSFVVFFLGYISNEAVIVIIDKFKNKEEN